MGETFELTKFSIGMFKNAAGAQSALDWQHYRQPALHLLLEKDYRHTKVQVIWTSGKDASLSTQNSGKMLKLEVVDLLEVKYSERPFAVSTPRLNAVHKGHLVALRYLPLNARSCANSEYRRFQAAFTSASEAARFVESIRDVCPCNGGAPAAAIGGMGLNAIHNPHHPSTAHTSGQPGVSQSQGSLTNSQLTRQMSSSQFPDTQYAFSQVIDTLSLPGNGFRSPNTQWSASLVPDVSLATPTVARDVTAGSVLTNIRSAAPSTSSAPQSQPQSLYRHEQYARDAVLQDVPLSTPPSSSHVPDVPTVSQNSRRNGNLDTVADANSSSSASAHVLSSKPPTLTPADPLFNSLRDAAGLEHLTQDQLEGVIAGVVREEGFEKLLGKLDAMWHLKGLIGI